MKNLLNIAAFEFKLTANNKSFLISTLLGPFFIVAVTILPTLLGQNVQDPFSIAVLNPSPSESAALNGALEGMKGEIIPVPSFERGRDLVIEEQVRGFVYPEDHGAYAYYTRSGTEINITSTLRAVLDAIDTNNRLLEWGFSPDEIEDINRGISWRTVKVDQEGEETSVAGDSFLGTFFTILAFVMIIYMTTLLYGQSIARSVVKEKTTKTVEILLSSVRPYQLLFGKVFGIGLAGIVQYAAWFGMAAVVLSLLGEGTSLPIDPVAMANNGVYLIVYFILAFFLYGFAYAALGSGAEDETHIGQLSFPIIIFLLVPMVMIQPIASNPDTTLAVFLSWFPMTSPTVMLIRILSSTPSMAEILGSMVLLLVTIGLMGWASSKIFRVGILMTGKRPNFGEIIRWVNTKV